MYVICAFAFGTKPRPMVLIRRLPTCECNSNHESSEIVQFKRTFLDGSKWSQILTGSFIVSGKKTPSILRMENFGIYLIATTGKLELITMLIWSNSKQKHKQKQKAAWERQTYGVNYDNKNGEWNQKNGWKWTVFRAFHNAKCVQLIILNADLIFQTFLCVCSKMVNKTENFFSCKLCSFVFDAHFLAMVFLRCLSACIWNSANAK